MIACTASRMGESSCPAARSDIVAVDRNRHLAEAARTRENRIVHLGFTGISESRRLQRKAPPPRLPARARQERGAGFVGFELPRRIDQVPRAGAHCKKRSSAGPAGRERLAELGTSQGRGSASDRKGRFHTGRGSP